MQRLAGEGAARHLSAWVFEGPPLASSIERVADDGMADVGHMDAYLVRAACDRVATQHRGPCILLLDLEVCAGWPPFRDHRHFLAPARVPVDRCIDNAIRGPRSSVTDCEIGLANRVPAKCYRQCEVGAVGFGDHHDSGRVFVKSVDDARALDAPNSRQILTVMEESVDQGAGGVSSSRMNDETGRFVDQQEILVFVDDVKRDFLSLDVEGARRRFVDHYPVPGVDRS